MTGENRETPTFNERIKSSLGRLGDVAKSIGERIIYASGLSREEGAYSEEPHRKPETRDPNNPSYQEEAARGTYLGFREIGNFVSKAAGLAVNSVKWGYEKVNELSYETARNIRFGALALATALNIWPMNPSLSDDVTITSLLFTLGLGLEFGRTIKKTREDGEIKYKHNREGKLKWTVDPSSIFEPIDDGEDTSNDQVNEGYNREEDNQKIRTSRQVFGLPLAYLAISTALNRNARWEGMQEVWHDNYLWMTPSAAIGLPALAFIAAKSGLRKHRDRKAAAKARQQRVGDPYDGNPNT